ncbi:MAG: amidohydrolase family protein [Rhodospirillaceae bacterium]|nr:amidohydrolase family protein [Rhodospirillaceae bacterium]
MRVFASRPHIRGAVGATSAHNLARTARRGPSMRTISCLFALIMVAAVGATPRADIAITNVSLLDGSGGLAQPGMTVVVGGDRVTAVGPTVTVNVPRAAQRIDGTGKFLMPGLMDMHIHLVGAGQWRGLSNPPGVEIDRDAARSALHSYLYFGVTSVYDAGNNPDLILDLRAKERAGALVSPRIFATGHAISYPGSWMAGSFHGVGAPDWPDTIKLLDAQVSAGPDVQKLVLERFGLGPNPLAPHLPVDLMGKIIDYMRAKGIRTTIHATTESLARDALDAGIDSFAHPVATGRMSDAYVKLLAERQIPVATTLSVYDEIIRLGEDPSYLDDEMFTDVLSAEEIAARKEQGPARFASLGWTSWFKALNPYLRENVKKLHDAGGVVVLATDRSEGPMIHRELELLAEIGIPPADIVRIGTLNGAKYLGREADLGTIAPGKLADLLLLDADPTADVRNARRINTVIKGGQVIDRSKLDLPVNARR